MSHTPLLWSMKLVWHMPNMQSSKQQVGFVTAPVTPALSSPPLRHSGGEADGESGVCLYAPFSFEEKRSVES